MSSGKLSLAQRSVRLLNKRIPAGLEREQHGLAKKLRKERYQKEPFRALAVFYDCLDRIYSYSDDLIACKKGCSYCCHMEIGLSQLEADFIAEKIGGSAKKLEQAPKENPDGWLDQNKPCPFLKNNQCSIYHYRPMNCRTYVSLEENNNNCRFDSESKIHNIDRTTSFPGAMKAYGELVARYGGHISDIRDFFGNSSIPIF